MKKNIIRLITIMFLILLSSCSLSIEAKKTVLVISLPASRETYTRTDAVNYTISISSNNYEDTKTYAAGKICEFSEIPSGEYNVSVIALNTDGYKIASGYTTVTVNENEKTVANIVLKPYEYHSVIYNIVTEDSTRTIEKTFSTGDNYTTITPGASLYEGFAFDGWYEDVTCTGDKVTHWPAGSITDDVILYAKLIYLISDSSSFTSFLDSSYINAKVTQSFSAGSSVTNSSSYNKTIDGNNKTISFTMESISSDTSAFYHNGTGSLTLKNLNLSWTDFTNTGVGRLILVSSQNKGDIIIDGGSYTLQNNDSSNEALTLLGIYGSNNCIRNTVISVINNGTSSSNHSCNTRAITNYSGSVIKELINTTINATLSTDTTGVCYCINNVGTINKITGCTLTPVSNGTAKSTIYAEGSASSVVESDIDY